MRDRGLRGKNVIVTGGLGGIGRACAHAFAEEGGNVAVFDLGAEDEKSAVQLIRDLRGKDIAAVYSCTDVSNSDAVQRGVRYVREQFGHIDILVNNAGKGHGPVPLEDLDEKDWDELIALNLKAAMLCSRAVIHEMKQRAWGRVINISSIAGRGRGELANISYASAKAGIIGFTHYLACEAGPYGVTVNAIAPGAIMSGRVTERWLGRSEEERKRMTDPIPLRRIGRPEDVAKAVTFLASEDASYITAATLDVNGGRYF